MNVRSLANGVAALSLAAVTVVLPATAAIAQQPADRCANAGGQNAQGNGPGGQGRGNGYAAQGDGEGVSNEEARPGEQQRASSGCRQFAPGQSVRVGVESKYQALGTTTASQSGEATFTFTVPNNLSNGRHHVVFTGPAFEGGGTNTVRVPFTVVRGAVVGANSGRSGQLPRTGSDDLVAIALGGSAMVALGAGMVVVSRRRRESTPAGMA